MSTQFIHQNGFRYAYDDSMYRLVDPSEPPFFQRGDWLGRVVPREGGVFERVFDYEIGQRIPDGAIVIRERSAPVQSFNRTHALFWIACGFLLWAVAAQVVDWFFNFD